MNYPILYAPRLHGALGYWDEVLNLLPLVMGGAALIYFYLTARRKHDHDKPKDKQEKKS
jgi:hypothetical protein